MVRPKLEDLKVLYEVKLEQISPGGYTATPDGTGEINVTAVEQTSGGTPEFKGFKHRASTGGAFAINYISIYNQPIKGITEVQNGDGFTTKDGGGLFVYYETEINKPLLICLSQNGTSSGTNKWYERVKDGQTGYTWNDVSSDTNYSDIKPDSITTGFVKELDNIKEALTGDKGYPNPTDRNDDITQPEDNAAPNVTIWIDKTKAGYDHSTGAEKTEASDIADGHVKVFLKNNEPTFPYTCYTHKVKGGSGKYKKIGTATLKNRDANLTKPKAGEPSKRDPIQESEVHYVHVYYFGDRPILIYVAIGSGDKPSEYKYYKPNYKLYNPYAVTTKWKDISTTINGAPDRSNTKLNDEQINLTLPLIGCILL